MNPLYVLGGIVAFLLLVYLVYALVRAEEF
ncbi:MAG: K(+)-transporting ATPase subunit F [Betaproteobacteria bacterium]|nr:K(+)-transporting ATPase subunit F [Thiomonas sp. FB-6]MBU6440698.1 K(+)-transporting ATPase subunit F [Betaproteobacteria bacterium]MBU6510806.1 K(+)-transporting ATPase subunit F [Betaproteobacteria bacterium]MDE1954265.1 K(+)-transporting ATPase subunit F [Betaproteobacteria bacterium]MDE2150929.1 K(+)-transporting ATPase subunit F [Betaproteobacteria bacterium]MDE2480042.1 K(+)-transporting ATPase subunit F [Betaproteobacteria bacterium]